MRARHLLAMFDDMSRTATFMKDRDGVVRYIIFSLKVVVDNRTCTKCVFTA